MILTRVYAPKLWWQALVAHIIYAAAILMVFSEYHLVPLVVIGLGAWKAVRRARLFHLANPGYEARADMHGWIVTLATFVWLGLLLASAFSRTIVWRGVRYRLGRPV